ncbi:hypothetical protein DFP72DRAFT_1073319 [Ephemerocybe angulata]|uniref:Uncharacterized protein n=1 Tax=Ephemerocybe angulata TaxID=980116 RepID=A0A8H6HLG1_9AGAR|nr:hypothetical protein DFP72DRAFT_1073319 [Tulosesus angulatus]
MPSPTYFEQIPDDLLREITKDMSLPDIAAIASLAPNLPRDTIHSRLKALLASQHLDPEGFLEKMAETNTVLSGSGALEIILPGTCTPGDLDFYCPRDEGQTLSFYLEANGFNKYDYGGSSTKRRSEDVDDDEEHYDNRNGINSVIRLRHDAHGSKIHIIESVSLSPLVPVFFFHSTVVMNFVSATAAVCFYPELTFRHQGLLNFSCSGADRKNRTAVQKYKERGFEIHEFCTALHSHAGLQGIGDPYPQESCSALNRRTDDLFGLKVPHTATYGSTVIRPRVAWRLGYRTFEVKRAEHRFDAVVTVNAEPQPVKYSNTQETEHLIRFPGYDPT